MMRFEADGSKDLCVRHSLAASSTEVSFESSPDRVRIKVCVGAVGQTCRMRVSEKYVRTAASQHVRDCFNFRREDGSKASERIADMLQLPRH